MLLKIYCENIVVIFLNQDFLLFILFLLSLISFHPYVSFLFFFFFSSTRIALSLSPPPPLSFIFFFSLIQEHSSSSHFFFFFLFFFNFSPALSFFFFLEHSSPTQFRWVIFVPNQLAQPMPSLIFIPNAVQMGQVASVFCLFFFFFFSFCYDLINFKIVFLSLYSDNLIILERKMVATERMREKKKSGGERKN